VTEADLRTSSRLPTDGLKDPNRYDDSGTSIFQLAGGLILTVAMKTPPVLATMLQAMGQTSTNVVIFAFRDSTRAAQVVATARDQTGVRSVALIGVLPDCEVRIVGGVSEEVTEARWLALALAVLDLLSAPLRVLAATTSQTDTVTLPDSDEGLATFARLVPRGALVILAAVCDEDAPAIGAFELGQALFQIPGDCAIRLSSRDRRRVPLSTSSAGSSAHGLVRANSSQGEITNRTRSSACASS
jgi:hypothetical protein